MRTNDLAAGAAVGMMTKVLSVCSHFPGVTKPMDSDAERTEVLTSEPAPVADQPSPTTEVEQARAALMARIEQERNKVKADLEQWRANVKAEIEQERGKVETELEHLRVEAKTELEHLRSEVKTDS